MRTTLTMVALAFALLAATTNTQAQDEPTIHKSRWSIGPKAGLNLSHFWGSDWRDSDSKEVAHPRLAGQFGVFVTWSNDRWFAVSGELLYSAKGTRYRFDNPFGGDDGVSVTRVDYIEMPILFRFFFVQDGAIRPHASFGPSWGVLVLARSKGLQPERTDATSFYDNANKIDFGLNFGGGVNIRLSESGIWLTPEVRYNLGLVNVPEDIATKNGSLGVSVGVAFPIGNAE